ncbi:MAG: sigma-70 family RNA polymerase sigma factor [Armatimonadetes bacterium]|nr:sigma-70 family RNA polymerase sigma factor [Armatimonadota bacterium]
MIRTHTGHSISTATSGKPDAHSQLLHDYVALRDNGAKTPCAALSDLKAKIAHTHTPLVESVARRFTGSGEPFEDLVQEGFLGLLSALENYDPERTGAKESAGAGRKIKFSTYATHFVAGAIRHFLRDRGKIIKEPAWLHEVSAKVSRTGDALAAEFGRTATSAEIARVLNLTEESVDEILTTRNTFQVAAFGTAGEDGDAMAVGLVDPEKIRSDKQVTLRLPIEDRIVLESAMLKLKELEQKVLFEFFYQDHSQTEIAKSIGISCNYVSHILKNATGKLKRVLGDAEVRDRSRTASPGVGTMTCASTGLLSAGHAASRFGEALARSARESRSCAVLHIHIGGLPERGLRREKMLSRIGETLHGAIRKVDIAGRATSPNDFLVFLPQQGAEQATGSATKLENLLLALGAAEGETLCVRVGAASYPDAGRTMSELVTTAQGMTRTAWAKHKDAPRRKETITVSAVPLAVG